MLPFPIELRPGTSVQEQVAYAVTKAIVSGQLRPGDTFPSVRTLSQELKINPNTAHKIVMGLVNEGLLEVRPGIGTVVGAGRSSTREERRALLDDAVERLVVEARRLSLDVEDVVGAVERHFAHLKKD
jgi:GntR family transcriptional regulator